MKIYLSHAYGGNKENEEHLEKEVLSLLGLYKDIISEQNYTLVSPIHALGFMYHEVPYDEGMRMCIELLKDCRLMITFQGYDKSKGCIIEQEYCKAHGITVLSIDQFKAMLDLIKIALLKKV